MTPQSVADPYDDWIGEWQEIWSHMWAWWQITKAGSEGLSGRELHQRFKRSYPQFFPNLELSSASTIELSNVMHVLVRVWKVIGRQSEKRHPRFNIVVPFSATALPVEIAHLRIEYANAVLAALRTKPVAGMDPGEIEEYLSIHHPGLNPRMLRYYRPGLGAGIAISLLSRGGAIEPIGERAWERAGRTNRSLTRWRIADSSCQSAWFALNPARLPERAGN